MMMLDRYKITNDSLTSLTGGGQPIGASPFSFPGIVGPIIGDELTPISPLSASSTLFYSSSQILEELRNACNCQLVAGAWKVHQGLLTVKSESGSLSFFSSSPLGCLSWPLACLCNGWEALIQATSEETQARWSWFGGLCNTESGCKGSKLRISGPTKFARDAMVRFLPHFTSFSLFCGWSVTFFCCLLRRNLWWTVKSTFSREGASNFWSSLSKLLFARVC